MKTVFVSSGHGKSWWGGTDNGACKNGQKERDINVEIGRAVIEELKKELPGITIQGVGVETSANNKARAAYINKVMKMNNYSARDCFCVDIHCNSHTAGVAKGVETWVSYKSPASFQSLASMIDEGIAILGTHNRGVKQTINHPYKRLYIDDYACPAVLVETAFISNVEDMKLIGTKEGRKDVAHKIAHAIITFLTV